jgi:hypothetical protein
MEAVRVVPNPRRRRNKWTRKRRGFLTRAWDQLPEKDSVFNGERTNKSLGLFGGVGLKGRVASWGWVMAPSFASSSPFRPCNACSSSLPVHACVASLFKLPSEKVPTFFFNRFELATSPKVYGMG